MSPPIPTPPATCRAPVMVDVAEVVLVIVKIVLTGLVITPVAPTAPLSPVLKNCTASCTALECMVPLT